MAPRLKRIRYFADLSPGTGFNNAARGYVRALETLGYTPEYLHLVPAVLTSPDHSLDSNDWIRPYVIGAWPEQEEINIVHLGVGLLGNYFTKGRYNIAITAWETNKLPGAKSVPPCLDAGPLSCVEAMNLYDEVWVPSQLVHAVFVQSGVQETKIRVVPHGLYYTPPDRKFDNADLQRGVRFYYIGSWNARKNATALLRAYWSTPWTATSPVSLFLHAVPPTRDPMVLEANDWLVRSEIDTLREAIRTSRRMDLPNYAPSTQYRPESWIRDAHLYCDAFVTASRGEGFCLPALEALAAGNLVIGGGGPVLEEFRTALGDVLADKMIRILPRQVVPITPMPEMLGYELDQEWWETSLRHLIEGFETTFTALREPGTDWATVRKETATKIQAAYSPRTIGEFFKRVVT